jgi:chorismate mutase
MTSVRAIRGATQAAANTAGAIDLATKELLLEIMKENALTPDSFISIIFTASTDLNAAFPASSAREIGFAQVPLICGREIDVPEALERAIRIMAHVESDRSKGEISHVFLGAAKALRKDLTQ